MHAPAHAPTAKKKRLMLLRRGCAGGRLVNVGISNTLGKKMCVDWCKDENGNSVSATKPPCNMPTRGGQTNMFLSECIADAANTRAKWQK